MSRPLADYAAYGLRLRSAIALPFVRLPEGMAGEPDVVIRFGAAPASLPAPVTKRLHWQTMSGRFLFSIDGVARYLVADGKDVLVERLGGSDHDIGVYLTGSVLAALLQQRGVATLHASAVETQAGAVLFLGRSGAGKSSLLAALVKRGYPMMADDVSGVVLNAGRPTLLPAFPNTRLWADVLSQLAWWPRAGARVLENMDKHLTSIDEFHAFPRTLRACFVLLADDRNDVDLRATTFKDAFLWLNKYTYRKQYLVGLERAAGHFRILQAIAKRLPVFCAMRPTHSLQLCSLAEKVDDNLQGRGALPSAMQLTRTEEWSFLPKHG